MRKVHDHRSFRDLVEARIFGGPVLATQEGEVTPTAPGDEFMGIPRFCLLYVPVEVGLHDRLQLRQHCRLHGDHLLLPLLSGTHGGQTYGSVTYATVEQLL